MKKEHLRLYFLCSQNRCRSQMAEAYAKHFSNDNVIVNSAGLEPSELHPLTIAVMKEEGIDISQQYSKKIDMKIFMAADAILKLCEAVQERCPVVPFAIRNEQWNITDPLASEFATIEVVRKARDEIKEKVIVLLKSYQAYDATCPNLA